MRLTFLGTGNAFVTECYNTCFAITGDKGTLLVDAGGGNGILRALRKADINYKDITDIFVTHKHIDHLLGVMWLIRLYCQRMREGVFTGEVTLYSHDEVIKILTAMADMLLQEKEKPFFGTRFRLVTVTDGEEREIIESKFTFFDIGSTKAKQFGFSADLCGKKFVCCGDEPVSARGEAYAKNADWLLTEAFCLYGEADRFKPYEKHHSTVKDAAELAEKLNVKNLVLYHTEDKNIFKRKELYTEEGKKYFNGNLFVPDDLESFTL